MTIHTPVAKLAVDYGNTEALIAGSFSGNYLYFLTFYFKPDAHME